MICGDTTTYGWMDGLMGGLMSNHKNQINLDLIEIIQFWTFLTFLDILLKPPQPLMGLFLFNLTNNSCFNFLHLTYNLQF